MAFTATLKTNYSDLYFGSAVIGNKAELLKISIHRIYNQNGGTLIAFRVDGHHDEIEHLTANDGAIYMSLNEMKWLSHHLSDVRFKQLKGFFTSIINHVKDVVAMSEEFEEYHAAVPSYLDDTVYIAAQDTDVIISLFNHILTVN